MNILITGATGFIGRRLIQTLLAQTPHRIAVLTRQSAPLPDAVQPIRIDAIDGDTDYGDRLTGFDVIVHLAARVHRLDDTHLSAYPAYKAINTDGTLNLARQAAAAGVRRFIYLSSIKVNGESTTPGHPFRADDPPQPSDPYAISKHEAERALALLSQETGLEYVIIRPPLVYGPGVKANFQRLLGMVRKGLPLPLGAVDNRRSLVSLDNLTSLIRRCLDHPAAANQVFLVSDDRDLSTAELLRQIAAAMHRTIRLLPFPPGLLALAARLLGREDLARRLLGNLQVDISKTKRLLGWQPVSSVEEGLRETAQSYLQQTR